MVSDTLGAVANGVGFQGTVIVDGTGSTWTNSGTLQVGALGTGTLTISGGGTVSSAGGGSIGLVAGSHGVVTVTGAGSIWNNIAPSAGLNIGSFGTGTLTIENGGKVINISGFAANIGNSTGSQGTVMVTGPGSTWTNNVGLNIGNSGTGFLNILNAGTVTSNGGTLGASSGSAGTVTVDGTASMWTSNAQVVVGSSGTGTLNITNGGKVTDSAGYIALAGGSVGTVTVDGTNSTWTNSPGNVFVGYGSNSTGTLTIENGGFVIARATLNPVFIANFPGSTGTLNIGAAPGSSPVLPGTLETSQVIFGSGTGTINFNHTATGYEFAPAISGPGKVNVLSGTTILTANNTYSGGRNWSCLRQ
jgi:T5SS/PEP-CTERM-associated repeat protein